MKHYSVLKKEIIDSLKIKSDGIYVDATLGYGGMSSEILKKLTTGRLIAFDQDNDAIKYSDELLKQISENYVLVKSNFVNMKEKLLELGITKVDGIIFDLGFSSPQIDEVERGFSFMNDAPLDMRMDREQKLTAYEVVNEMSENELVKYFYLYGEEKKSKFIANKICSERKKKKINTTLELVEVIKMAVGANYFYKNHPERKIFQAIRIIVNDELNVLTSVLPDAIELLNSGGRLSVISFHSLEDKIVKNIFKSYSEVEDIVKGLPDIPLEYQPKLKIINKKPIVASEEELKENTRSHSAKLRIVERI